MTPTPPQRAEPRHVRRRLASFSAALVVSFLLVVPSSAFGLVKGMWVVPSTSGSYATPWATYQKLGVTMLEFDLPWDTIAPTQPTNQTNPNDPAYKWPSQLATALSAAAAHKMTVLLRADESPAWAAGGHTGGNWAPNAQDFTNFMTAAAKHYPGVHLWMIWDEPTRPGSFQPLNPVAWTVRRLTGTDLHTIQTYALMVNGTYLALKKLSKKNLIIGGDSYTTGDVDSLQWVDNLRLPDGKPPQMDMYGENPYSSCSPTFGSLCYGTTGPTPLGEVQFRDLPELATAIDQNLKKGMPLFLSEFSMPTGPANPFNFWVDQPVATRWVTQAMKEARGWSRIYGLGWWTLQDSATIQCGLLFPNGTPKPDFYSFAKG